MYSMMYTYLWHDVGSGLKERVELFPENEEHCSGSLQPRERVLTKHLLRFTILCYNKDQ